MSISNLRVNTGAGYLGFDAGMQRSCTALCLPKPELPDEGNDGDVIFVEQPLCWYDGQWNALGPQAPPPAWNPSFIQAYLNQTYTLSIGENKINQSAGLVIRENRGFDFSHDLITVLKSGYYSITVQITITDLGSYVGSDPIDVYGYAWLNGQHYVSACGVSSTVPNGKYLIYTTTAILQVTETYTVEFNIWFNPASDFGPISAYGGSPDDPANLGLCTYIEMHEIAPF